MLRLLCRCLVGAVILLQFATRNAEANVSTFGCGNVSYCTIAQLTQPTHNARHGIFQCKRSPIKLVLLL